MSNIKVLIGKAVQSSLFSNENFKFRCTGFDSIICYESISLTSQEFPSQPLALKLILEHLPFISKLLIFNWLEGAFSYCLALTIVSKSQLFEFPLSSLSEQLKIDIPIMVKINNFFVVQF
jgi:hypothetical protein